MIVLLVVFLVSLVPSILLYLLLSRLKDNEPYRKACRKALLYGVLAGVVVVLVSGTLDMARRIALKSVNPLVQDALYAFVVLALSEELVKFLMGRRVIGRELASVSRLDLIAVMGIVGIGFQLNEDIPFAIGANVPMMVVRGITVSHGVYGMLMGWCLARTWRGGRGSATLAVGLPALVHGLYDFGLSDSLIAISDNWMLLSVGLTMLDIALLIGFVLFVRRARMDGRYTEPLG